MLSKLIEITNSDSFIQNGYIITKSVTVIESTLTMTFQLVDNLTEQILYDCELRAENIAYSTSNRMHEASILYNQINLYHNHPILWNFERSPYYILHGPVKNLPALVGDLYIAHDQTCGNWVEFHRLVFGLAKRLNSGLETRIELPESLANIYLEVFTKHNLGYTQKGTREGHGYYKVLVVGHAAISPDWYNLGQPNLVAESFMASIEPVNKPISLQ